MNVRPLIICLLFVGLSGCGFQLRGENDVTLKGFGVIAVAGLDLHDPLYQSLQRQLVRAGARLSSPDIAPDWQLRVGDRRSTRRVFSVDARNKSVEFELEESLGFSLRGKDGATPIERQRLRSLRISLNPEIQVLGRNREEAMLRADMHQELAERIIDRLNAVR